MASTTPIVDMAVKTENVVFARYSKLVADEKNPNSVKSDFALLKNPTPEQVKEQEDLGRSLEFEQTVTLVKAGTVDGISELVKDDDERVAIFNRGVAQKLNQKLSAIFNETKEDGTAAFEPVDGAYDVTAILNEPTQRRNLTPVERAIKQLKASGLDDAAVQAAVAAILGSQN